MADTKSIVEIWTLLHVNYTYFARQLVTQYGDEGARDMLDKLLSGIWIPVLKGVPSEILKAAALQYVARGHTYFPQVGELREIALDLMDAAEGRDTTPYDGWAEVMRLMRSHSIYDRTPVEFRDPLAGHALDAIGGMRAVRFCNETALPVLLSQFVRAYRAIQERASGERRMLPEVKALIGRLAMDNLIEAGERQTLGAPASDPTEWNG